MGIVNRTPDSFYDGGRMGLDESVEHAVRLSEEGADILDLGGIKAGPGEHVSAGEEADRLLPLVEALAGTAGARLSVETDRARIAARALAAGASIVNDVSGLSDPGLARVCAATGSSLVLVHHGGQIRGRPRHPRYADVVEEVAMTWTELAGVAVSLGMPRESLVMDPGLDFGKTTFHSLELVRRLDELTALGSPVLVAPSRKDIVGETLDLPLQDRLEGTLALVALAVSKGAAIVRVHDVARSVRTVRMVEAAMGRRSPQAPVRGLWE